MRSLQAYEERLKMKQEKLEQFLKTKLSLKRERRKF